MRITNVQLEMMDKTIQELEATRSSLIEQYPKDLQMTKVCWDMFQSIHYLKRARIKAKEIHLKDIKDG